MYRVMKNRYGAAGSLVHQNEIIRMVAYIDSLFQNEVINGLL